MLVADHLTSSSSAPLTLSSTGTSTSTKSLVTLVFDSLFLFTSKSTNLSAGFPPSSGWVVGLPARELPPPSFHFTCSLAVKNSYFWGVKMCFFLKEGLFHCFWFNEASRYWRKLKLWKDCNDQTMKTINRFASQITPSFKLSFQTHHHHLGFEYNRQDN